MAQAEDRDLPEPDDRVAALQRRLWGVVVDCFAQRRRMDGLTQADLARALGVPRGQISVWLREPDRMTLRAAARLLGAMGCEVSFALSLSPVAQGTAS